MRGFLRKLLLSALALGALAALAYFSRRKIHLGDFTWSRFVHAVGQANVWLLLISIISVYCAYALRALRWQRLSRYLGPSSFLDVYSATVMGFASIFILGRAGEPVRPLLLAGKTHQPVPGMFGVWVFERMADFSAAGALAALSLLVFPGQLADAGVNTDWVQNARAGGWLLLAMLAGVVILMVYFRLHGARVLERLLRYWHGAAGLKGWLAAILSGFSEGLQAIRTWPDLLITAFYTCIHWIVVTLAYLWIARAFAGDFIQSAVTVPGAMLLLAITLVGSVLQLPGVGGGAQVASFIALTTIFGVEQEPAAAIALVLWLITFAASTLAGVPLLIHEGLSMGELRNLARAEAAAEKTGEHVSLTRVAGHTSRDQSREGGVAPLKCPFCAFSDDKVIDSRQGRTGDLIRRRRECLKCGRRFTTYERIDEIPYMVIKKDGRRERFDRQKILQGLLKSCEKRPLPTTRLEALVDEMERFVHDAPERERTTSELGELLMARLKRLDKVAYVRFASVYLDFKDVREFMNELKGLLRERSRK